MEPCPSEIAIDDVGEIYADTAPRRDGELLQLDAGPLGVRGRMTRLCEAHVYEWQYGARLHGCEVRKDGILSIHLRTDVGPPDMLNGVDIEYTVPMLRHSRGEPVEFTTPRDLRMLEIDIPQSLVDIFGWNPSHVLEPLRISQARLRSLRTVTGHIARLCAPSAGPEEHELRAAQDRLLLAVGACLREHAGYGAAPMGPGRAAGLVRDAQAWIKRRPLDERLSVPHLAAELDVSERTLYKAFQERFGVGPYEFDLLRRLHIFRTDLIRGPQRRGEIGRAARRAGFKDQSRLGQMYRRHFGETPSVTARRWRRSPVV